MATVWMLVLLDDLDARILRLLREDARYSFRDVAEKSNSTVPTVSARVKALEDLGLIRGYHADIDLAMTGGSPVQITVQAKASDARRLVADLAAIDGVQDVALLAGGLLQARARMRPPERTIEALHDAIAKLDGVISYDARTVIATRAVRNTDDIPTRVDVECRLCHGPIHDAPVRKTFGERTHVFCCRQCLSDFAERYEKMGAKAYNPRAKPKPHAGHHHTH